MTKPPPGSSLSEACQRHDASALPVVAIIGRPNVGKSALFNRLARRRIAIVHDQPGVTRDRIEAVCQIRGQRALLVDTGGIGGAHADGFGAAIEREAQVAIGIASVILFVVDAKDGLTPSDGVVAEKLRKASCPVLLVVNKVDEGTHETRTADFHTLGFARMVSVSAAHGRGVPGLLDLLAELLPSVPHGPAARGGEDEIESSDRPRPPRIAIVGKPNAGKSSLVNALLHEQRTIVSEVPGTTRDAVDIACRIGGREAVLIDTAGLRHRRKHRTSVEVFSAMRAEESIRRADLCILAVDLSEGVTVQDKKIGQLVQEAAKPVIIAGGKLDLLKNQLPRGGQKELSRMLLNEFFFLSHAPVVLVSAQTGENIPRLAREIWKVARSARRRISTGRLNRLIQDVQTATPPPFRGRRRLKIFYATELEESSGPIPVPVFVLFVNDPALFDDSYRRCLENRIREVEPYPGLPLKFKLRGREQRSTR